MTTTNSSDVQQILSRKDLCQIFNKSPSTIDRWRKSGALPQPVIVNGQLQGWKKEDIDKLLSTDRQSE